MLFSSIGTTNSSICIRYCSACSGERLLGAGELTSALANDS
jgi:hypothetical protein